MGFEFTPSQRRAIEDRGGAILVSAAAGSGKTRVLTERLLRRVTDPEHPVDVDRFLVITYTRTAAAELRGRIMEELAKRAAEHPEDRRLRRQQTLCCRAHIGTIHSFCTEIVRENCHQLAIPPAFTVADEERAESIRSSVLSRLLDKHYEKIGGDAAFRSLADTVGAGRDDRKLESAVLSVYEKLRSQPWPGTWAEKQKAALRCEELADAKAEKTPWGRELLSAAKAEAAYRVETMEAAIQEITAAGGAIEKAYLPSFSATAEALRDFVRALDSGWDRARAFCREIPFPKLKALRNFDDEALKMRVTAARDACKKAIEELREIFAQSSEDAIRDLRATAPAMGALLDLALELDAAFSAEKLRRGCLDFSDLEHYAAKLLVDPEGGGPTWIAFETSQRFEEVMVDEYQDVSPIQDLIFRAVTRDERNLFLVGDVKQSIYRFRLAEPALFLEKYDAYKNAAEAAEGEPRKILLRENFRSRAAVLDAANLAFSNLMSRDLGELDYDTDAALIYGAQGYPEGTDVPVEFDVIEAEPAGISGGEVPPEKNELEAVFVAEKILAMMDAGTPVCTPDGPRRCEWGDFVILLRSPGARGAVFHRALAARGIPVESGSAGGFFTSLEITVAVNLLSLVDNPHADVPLISVLRSPVFNFSADELSAIRADAREGDFYAALRAAAEGGNKRCVGFLRRLDAWRAVAPDLSLDALLWRVCGDTDLFAVCSAMRDGDTRRRNLMRLFEYARAFSEGGYRGVFRFINWLRRLAERGAEPPSGGGENAVRIMSIHKSKGLEFPFVFLCDLNHQFNKKDTQSGVLLHSALGLGPKLVDTALGVEYPTIARMAIARRLTSEMLSEELRVLYVGMTRARERLYLTCTRKGAAEALEKLRLMRLSPVPPAVLRAAPAPDRWLALAALAGEGEGKIAINIVDRTPSAVPPEPAQDAAGTESGEAFHLLCENLRFTYPFAEAANLPSRLTATEMKDEGAGAAMEDPEAGTLLPTEERFEFRRVDLGRARALTPAEKGTATHTFLQYLDFSRTETEKQLLGELKRAATGRLSPEGAEAVDLAAVLKLFASPLGRGLRRAAQEGTLRREFRFTLLTPAADYFTLTAGVDVDENDELLLQGVADCFFPENGTLTIVDYKTDRVSAAEAPARAERYRGQLRAYAAALGRITGMPVGRCVLWFLRPGVAVEFRSIENQ